MIRVINWYIMELIKSHEMEGDTMTMNVALLKYYIGLRGMNLTQFAALLGVNRSFIYAKLRKPDSFSRSDIKLIMQTLDLTPDELLNIFFPDVLTKGNDN